MRFLAIIALASFLSIALYGAVAPHGLMHEGGCLSAVAFGMPCLSGSLEGHLKLFSLFGLVLPILILLLLALLRFLGSLLPFDRLFLQSVLSANQGLPNSDRLIRWLSLREHSPTVC